MLSLAAIALATTLLPAIPFVAPTNSRVARDAARDPVRVEPIELTLCAADDPLTGFMIVGKEAEAIVSGDGVTCLTYKIENTGAEPAIVFAVWGTGDKSDPARLDPGESHVFSCAMREIYGSCVQDNAGGEETTKLTWTKG